MVFSGFRFGLPILAPAHTLISWLFATFIVMHVYLTTAAGHTPTAGIQSMVTGWDELEIHAGKNATGDKETGNDH